MLPEAPGQPNAAAERRFDRAFKALQSISAAYGGPADNPRIIDFVDMGGVPAQSALDDGVVKELTGLPHLSRLRINWSGVTDEGLKSVAKMQSLTELELESTRITDAGLRELKGLKNLAVLNLADTKVTDAGLEVLCEMPQLSSLNLRGARVTEDGLKQLAHCKNLRHRLTYFPVTDQPAQET